MGLDSGLAPERGNLDELADKAKKGTLKPDDPILVEDPNGKLFRDSRQHRNDDIKSED